MLERVDGLELELELGFDAIELCHLRDVYSALKDTQNLLQAEEESRCQSSACDLNKSSLSRYSYTS